MSTLTWGALVTLLPMVFVLGAAPVFVVRLIARIYPKGHPRRAELAGEMERVTGLSRVVEQWRWLGEMFALAVCDGVPIRIRVLHPIRRLRPLWVPAFIYLGILEEPEDYVRRRRRREEPTVPLSLLLTRDDLDQSQDLEERED